MWQRFRRRPPATPAPPGVKTTGPVVDGPALEVIPASALLGPRLEQRLSAMRLESALEAHDYNRVMLAPVLACADWVQQLPATRETHHREAGGLIRLAVECASVAMRRVDGRLLHTPGEGLGGGVQSDTAWRLAAVLGGLFRAVGSGVGRWQVRSADGKRSWNPYETGLGEWARTSGGGGYRVTSAPAAHRVSRAGAAPWIASRCLGPECLARLQRGDGSAMGTLLDVLGGHARSVLGEIVEDALRAVRTDDENRALLNPPRRRPAVQEKLLGIMRRLVRRRWTLNRRGGRLLLGSDGRVYLQWEPAAQDILAAWREEHEGEPDLDARALSGLLRECGLVEPNPAARGEETPLFHVRVRLNEAGPVMALVCVRLPDPRIFALDVNGAEPVELRLAEPDGDTLERAARARKSPGSEGIGTAANDEADKPAALQRARETRAAEATASESPKPAQAGEAKDDRSEAAPGKAAAPARTTPEGAASERATPERADACLPGLSRYGDLGRALSRLARQDGALMRVADGLAVRTSALTGQLTQKQFIELARPQGLLVSDRPRSGVNDHTAPDEPHIVLAARMADALGIGRGPPGGRRT